MRDLSDRGIDVTPAAQGVVAGEATGLCGVGVALAWNAVVLSFLGLVVYRRGGPPTLTELACFSPFLLFGAVILYVPFRDVRKEHSRTRIRVAVDRHPLRAWPGMDRAFFAEASAVLARREGGRIAALCNRPSNAARAAEDRRERSRCSRTGP